MAADAPANDVTFEQLLDWLVRWDELLIEQRAHLGELDAAIGDGDHGSNMVRGLAAASGRVDAESPTSLDDLFKTVAMAIISSTGGASGPLYGTFFLRLGADAGHVSTIDLPGFAAAVVAGFAGVIDRGKAELGDKTMVDAMAPAVDALVAAAPTSTPASAAAAAAAAAHEGRESTADMLARKGRASYLGERSVGHIDPGATSTALLFQALAEALA